MIIDKVENFRLYHFGKVWQQTFEFLSAITADSNEGKYNIDGEDIFAIVMSYQTSTPEMAIFESHEKYIDIQTVIVGGEGFECAFSDELNIIKPYDTTKDVTFYERTSQGQIRVDVFPGTFVMLYPNDAHIAGLIIGTETELVKKVVVKIKRELLNIDLFNLIQ